MTDKSITIEIDRTAPLESQWRSVIEGRELLKQLSKEHKPKSNRGRPDSPRVRKTTKETPTGQHLSILELKPFDRIQVTDENGDLLKGEFKIDRIDIDKGQVLVYGGERNREKARVFRNQDHQFYRLKP